MQKRLTLSLVALAALGLGSSLSAKNVTSLSFEPVSISANDAEKKEMRTTPMLHVTYDDNSQKDFPLSYKVLAKTGDKIGNGQLGLMVDQNGQPIKEKDGSVDISENPDGNSLINVGGKTFLVTHMEEAPGMLYRTQLKLENGKLKAVDTQPVDLKAVGGTIINCASSRTRYGSHLGGEEDYALNTRYADKNSPFYIDCALDGSGNDTQGKKQEFCEYVDGMAKYLNETNIDKANGYRGERFTPYNYGYILEVQPQADGSVKSAKHYVTGKYTPELAVMMPDGKTVYITDDGTFKGLWKFVSDKKIDSFQPEWEGTLYAAKVLQLSDKEGGSFKLGWIPLGHAKDSEIKAMIETKPKLTDIFDIAKPDKEGSCPVGFKKINEDSKAECLRLHPGKEKEAAFLETRKYAAYKGATTEFRKEEGLTYNPEKNRLYLAMSQVKKSMEDNYKGQESMNDIRLPKNKCGAVYELQLDPTYNATDMKALVVGKPLKKGDQYADEWACDPNGIANPDNIKYLGHGTLLIGEDTKYHVNNMLWAYDTNTGKMTRIASLPIGAEVTGLEKGVVGDKGVLFVDAQHPFKDSPKAADGSKPNSALLEKATPEEQRAFIGYIDGIPAEVTK
jgi:secreted PhoX family phosphatase